MSCCDACKILYIGLTSTSYIHTNPKPTSPFARERKGLVPQTMYPPYCLLSLIPARMQSRGTWYSAHLPRGMPLVIMEISRHTDHGPAVAGDMTKHQVTLH